VQTRVRPPIGRGRRLLGFVRLVHPFPSLVVTAVTVALVPLADSDAAVSVYLWLGIGMLCFQFSIGAANDVVDRFDDAVAKPWKPIPSGAVPRRVAVGLAALLAGTGLAVTAGMPVGAWLLGAAGLACGLVYDVSLKRTALSWLPLAVALPLVPAWVFVAADAWDALLWWAFPLGITLGLALHLANQAPDARDGKEPDVRGIAHRLGGRRAALLAISLFGLATLVAVLVLLFVSPGRAALAGAAGLLVFVMAPRASRYFGRDGLFGLLAMSTGVLAVVFLSAT